MGMLEAPSCARTAFEQLVTNPSGVRASEIRDLDAESQLVIVRRLLDEGIVVEVESVPRVPDRKKYSRSHVVGASSDSDKIGASPA